MDLIDFARYLASLLVVLGLLGGAAWLAKRGAFASILPAAGGFAKPGARRLQVRETLVLDPRRRVVILAADGVEHVVLLGASGETVLETRPASGSKPVLERAA